MSKIEADVVVRHKDIVRCLNQALSYYQLFANGLPGEVFTNSLEATIDGEKVSQEFLGLVGDQDEVVQVQLDIWNGKFSRQGKVIVKLDEESRKFKAENYIVPKQP